MICIRNALLRRAVVLAKTFNSFPLLRARFSSVNLTRSLLNLRERNKAHHFAWPWLESSCANLHFHQPNSDPENTSSLVLISGTGDCEVLPVCCGVGCVRSRCDMDPGMYARHTGCALTERSSALQRSSGGAARHSHYSCKIRAK